MQFLIFIAALAVTLAITMGTYLCVAMLSSPAFGDVEMTGGRWAIVFVVAAFIVVDATVFFGAAAFAGAMVGLAAFHYFYKRFLRKS